MSKFNEYYFKYGQRGFELPTSTLRTCRKGSGLENFKKILFNASTIKKAKFDTSCY